MAINFKQQKISSPEYNLYQIQKFNGVDYTTTPVSVDDSRATDISNYLPEGNALHKRNGWEVVNKLIYNGMKLNVYNMFFLKTVRISDKDTHKYIAYANYKENGVDKAGLFLFNELEEKNSNHSITLLKSGVPSANNYSSSFAFESRLFVLAMNNYFMIYDDNGTIICDEVANHVYVPLVLAGLGDKDGQEQAVQIKAFNMLGNTAKIKIVNYIVEDNANTKVYQIAKAIGMTDRTITITKIDGTTFTSGMTVTNVGTFTWDSTNQELSIARTTSEGSYNSDGTPSENISYITVEFEYSKSNKEIDMVKKMQFGISYGSYGHKDRLFLAGNPDFPNTDIHTGETNDDETSQEWTDYTYFPDDSYHKFGTYNNAITGYGLLSNGYMAVFMKSVLGEPNLYLRHFNITTDSDGNYIEQFPVYVSGIAVENVNQNQIIKYCNDLLVNTPKGIYKVLVTDSTATQTYATVEMSYFIRSNLGTNVEDSCNVVYNGQLFVCRSDYTTNDKGEYNAKKRVYVADSDRYSFIDGRQVYEWWVLDGINAIKMFNLKDFSINKDFSSQTESLYFIDNNYGLCKLNTKTYDTYTYEPTSVNIGDSVVSSELFVDTENDKIILDTTSKLISEITNNKDVEKYYNIFKDYYKISFNIPLLAKVHFNTTHLPVFENNILTVYLENAEILQYAHMYLFNIIYGGKIYNLTNADYITEDVNGGSIIKADLILSEVGDTSIELDTYTLGIVIPANTEFGIENLYEKINDYPLNECYVYNNTWYHKQGDDIIEIGNISSVYFNKLKLTFNTVPLDIDVYGSDTLSKATFFINNPIESYWYGKHTALGRIDYLKTVDNITFIPETRNGGYTTVGYRTFKSDVDFITRATNQSFNFEDIDFSDFSFGGEAIAQSYTSKKKIKNFSFMQLKLYSNDNKNSTLTSIAFRYKYTRKNKGVK